MRGQGKLQSDTYFDAWSGAQLQFHPFLTWKGYKAYCELHIMTHLGRTSKTQLATTHRFRPSINFLTWKLKRMPKCKVENGQTAQSFGNTMSMISMTKSPVLLLVGNEFITTSHGSLITSHLDLWTPWRHAPLSCYAFLGSTGFWEFRFKFLYFRWWR